MESPSLDEAVAHLKRALIRYPFRYEHFIADLLLVNLSTDVLEHAMAVQVLGPSDVPRAAHANARAAVEAAQDLMLLTADESGYDQHGYRARAFELLETQQLQERFHRANAATGLSTQEAGQSARDIIAIDAAECDARAPGTGVKLLDAFHAMARSKLPRHWSGMTRKQLTIHLEASPGGEAGFGMMQDAIYGVLSIHSHPRPRMSKRQLEEQEDGHIVIPPAPDDREIVDALTSWACAAAASALTRRRGFFTGAT